jgi:hypothetical protein
MQGTKTASRRFSKRFGIGSLPSDIFDTTEDRFSETTTPRAKPIAGAIGNQYRNLRRRCNDATQIQG